MFNYYVASRKGERRDKNNDCAYIDNQVLSDNDTVEGKRRGDSIVAVVCDGVGSTKGGGYAARMVAESFKNTEDYISDEKKLSEHIFDVHNQLKELQKIMPSYRNMATTVAGIILFKNQYIAFNAGDTRIYKCSKNKIEQISVDHVENNGKESNNCKPHNAALTRYLGGYIYNPLPFVTQGLFDSDDIFLLCSDGIYKERLEEQQMKSIIAAIDPIKKLRAILHNRQNSSDDSTIMTVKSKQFAYKFTNIQ